MGGIQRGEHPQAGAAVAGLAAGGFLTRLLVAIASVSGRNDRGGLMGHPEEGLCFRYDAGLLELMCPALLDGPGFGFWSLQSKVARHPGGFAA